MPLKTTQFYAFYLACLCCAIASDIVNILAPKNDAECEVATTSCPPNYLLARNPDFCIRYSYIQLRWVDARLSCQREKADLLVFHSPYRKHQMISLYKELVKREFWLALNDRHYRGRWTWDVEERNTTQYENNSFNMWQRTNPSLHCSKINIKQKNFYQTDCHNKHHLMCEQDSFINGTCPGGGISRQYRYTKCRKLNREGDIVTTLSEYDGCPAYSTVVIVQKSICIVIFKEPVTLADGVKLCKKHNLTLIKVENLKKLKILGTFDKVWIGLHGRDGSSFGKWLDTDAYTVFNTNLRRKQFKKCGYIDDHIDPREEDCSTPLTFFCQRESIGGPSDVHSIEVKYFRRNTHLLFPNEPVEVTCTTYGTQTGEILWTAVDFQSYKLTYEKLSNVTISQERKQVVLETGECRTQTTSTYRYLIQRITHTHISCFSSPPRDDDEVTCYQPVTYLEFCNSVRLNIPVDRYIKIPPVLNVTYKGMPNPMKPGAILTVSCYLYVGVEEKPFWAIFDKHNNYAANPFTKHQPKITSNLMYVPGVGRRGETIFQLEMQPYMSGLSIGCFPYDAVKYLGPYLKCYDEDMYCVQSKKILVEQPTESFFTDSTASSWFWFIMLFLLALLIIAFLMNKVQRARSHEREQGDG